MTIAFFKYQGTGNDFVMIDNRDGTINLSQPQIARLCHRQFGIGADGLMELTLVPDYDFGMVYYNADGHLGSMCGNGGRCITQFAYDIGIKKSEYHFLASDGAHQSRITPHRWVQLGMQPVHSIERHTNYDFLNTGSPHVVKTVVEVSLYNVVAEGRSIRNHENWQPHGVNVNFVEVLQPSHIFVRTYERGVENETLSCGTGVTAAALVNAHNARGFNHVDITTLGGKLYVQYDQIADDKFENIILCGPATQVFSGSVVL
ncbi:MAG: diaminopimelate epimerase [Bacteroidetes bacterium]|nr:MAG: diaminopimelate epimerase [Bacteroidota bacterium]